MSLHRLSRYSSSSSALLMVAIAAIVMVGTPAAKAATQTWTGAVDSAFTTTGNWNTGVPGAVDTALWNASSTSNLSISVGTAQSLLGLQLTSPSGAVTLSGSAVTLGTGGIDMSAATQNLSVGPLVVGSGGQTWNVATGRSLTASSLTRTGSGATLVIDRRTNTGAVTASPTLTNSVVPWATVWNSGAAANGSANGYTFATVSGGTIAAYTGATSQTTAGSAWGGIPSGGGGTVNYDINVGGALGATGLSRNVNTIRYTGTGATQPGNISPVGNLLTTNALVNVGTGTYNIGGTGGAANNYGINVTVGAANELILGAMTADLLLRNGILNGAAGTSAVTVIGGTGRTVSISGATSNYSGPTSVNGGTLAVIGAGSINTTSGITVNGQSARYLHTSSVASTPAITVTRGTLDGTGSVGAVTVGNGLGGVVTNGNGGTSALTLSSLTFSGVGTATVNSGGSAGLVVTGALSTSGVDGRVTINAAGTFASGTTNLISFGSFASADINDFTLGTVTGASPRALNTLVLNGNNVALAVNAESVVWSGTGTGLWQTGVTGTVGVNPNWALATSQTPTDFWAADNAQFNDTVTVSGSTYTPVSLVSIAGGNVSPTTTIFNNSAVAYTVSSGDGSGIAGGSVTKNGSGALTLSTSNSYSAGTTLNAGLLNVNNASALGSGVVTITGGTLGNSSGAAVTLTTNNLQTWTSDVVFAGPDSLNMGNGRVTLGGAGTRTVTVSSGTLTVGGVTGTSVSGTLGFTKTGPGTLTLNPTAISGALGSAVGDLTIADGTLNMGGFDLTTTGLTGSGTLANGSNTTRWFFSAVSSGTKTFDGSLQDGTGTGKLGFNVSGGGTQIVNGNGNWSDTTTVNGVTTKLVLNGVNSGTSLTQLQGGPTLQFGNTAAIAAGSRVNLDGAQTATVIYATDGGDNAYAFQGSSNSTLNIVLDRATAGTDVTHPMSTPDVGVAGFGGGTFTANFTRGANVSGTATAAFTQFNLGGGGGGSTTVSPAIGTVVTIGTVTKALNNSSQTLVLGGVTTGNTVTGVISNGAVLTGGNAISLVKSNTSTWALSGNSTYTGTTAVLGGILNVNGDNSAATGAVTVAGGSLGGIGSLGGAITVSTGGTIIPGASIGTLTGTQSVSFTDGSTYGYEINSALVTADLLRVGTNLNLSGTVTLTLTDLSSSTVIPQNTVLSLVNYGGSWNGGLLTYSGSALADEDLFTFGVNQFRIDYNSTVQGSNVTSPVGANFLNLVAVPEPTVTLAALASLGLAGLVFRRRQA